MNAKEIGQTIANQLTRSNNGYAVLSSFVGAKDMAYFGENETANIVGGMQFKFKMSKAANCCRIELTPADMYIVKFYKIRGLDCKEVANYDETYCDQLKDLFEQFTGLYLSFK